MLAFAICEGVARRWADGKKGRTLLERVSRPFARCLKNIRDERT